MQIKGRFRAAVSKAEIAESAVRLCSRKRIGKKFLIARAFAKRFATRRQTPQIISADAIAAGLGQWARGFALDPRLSGAMARRQLGWTPVHLDPLAQIARLP